MLNEYTSLVTSALQADNLAWNGDEFACEDVECEECVCFFEWAEGTCKLDYLLHSAGTSGMARFENEHVYPILSQSYPEFFV